MHFRHLLAGLGALFLLSGAAHAQQTQGISQHVAVCNPKFPNQCAQPDANGALPTTGGGGGGGGNTPTAPTDASSTITSGTVFQTAFAQNSSRVTAFIENPTDATEILYVHWTAATPGPANSASLGPGSSISFAGNNTVVTSQIQVMAATTGHVFVATGS